MKRWYFPSWSGDFRLEADGVDQCILTVVKPTPAELDKLDAFLKVARKKDWIRQHVGFVPNGESRIEVETAIQNAGRYLLGEKPKGKLTAVKSTNGHVTAVWDDADKADEATKKPDAEEAATVRRPTLCCPNPIPGPDQRASEVLAAFCTRRQWEDWVANGWLFCYGNLSGRRYQIVHRHHPLAQARGKCIWDVEAGKVMHCYDWSVPPAEEALAFKLVMENREDWVRNASGAYNHFGDQQYIHPYMSEEDQAADGLADAAFVSNLGPSLVAGLGMAAMK